MEDPSHLPRRVSAGMRRVVTFVAGRKIHQAARESGAATHLLDRHAAPTSSPGLRRWLPTALAGLTTLLSAIVLWSIVARLPTVFADTGAMAAEIERLKNRVHPDARSADEQLASETAITRLLQQEDEAQQRRTRLNADAATISSAQEEAASRVDVLLAQRVAEEREVDAPRKRYLEVFGRDIMIREGPPRTFDPGPEPAPPWYGGSLAYRVFSRDYFNAWNVWKAAKDVCDRVNEFQRVSGIELATLEEKKAVLQVRLDACKGALAEADAVLARLDQERRRYTSAPAEVLTDLDGLRRRLAHTSLVRNVFWALDIPTLLSCLATTAVAWSRMCLLSGWFGPRQLARSRP